jgi:hypothetical protein
MRPADLLPLRLYNQHMTGRPFKSPQEVVAFLGAVQAQDYPGTKWAIAQRMTRITDAALDEALATGAILRTHVMRPTWHFVAPADIRWMLALTGPRVFATTASYFRKLKLDDAMCARANAAFAAALKGGRQLTRAELSAALREAGALSPRIDPLQFGFLLMRAELDAVICSGARCGRQFTYALLEERVPAVRAKSREEARTELTKRYFSSHGPASIKDFMWWSGLTAADAKAGLEANASALTEDAIDGRVFWRPKGRRASRKPTGKAYLLTTYDECFIAYRTRGAALEARELAQVLRDNGQTIVIDGKVTGTWRRTIKGAVVILDAAPFRPLGRRHADAVAQAADRFSRFLQMPVTLRVVRG